MRNNSKYGKLYQELYLRISNGFYPPNSLLPKEIDFAREFGVSRKTLRMALEILESEKMIRRCRSMGTYVASEEQWVKPTVTLLLPCEFYQDVDAFTAYFNSMLVEGAIAGCQLNNCYLETIPISSFNDLEHINRYRLNHLNRTSMVIVPTSWYLPLFPFLEERQCRVFYIASGSLQCRGRVKIPAAWRTVMLDDFRLFENAAITLRKKNCRKIALASCWIDESGNAILEGFRSGLQKSGQAEELARLIPDVKEPAWPHLKEQLSEWQRQTGFDGLILCPDGNDLPLEDYFTHESLGLPESVEIVLTYRATARQLMFHRIMVHYFDLKELAIRAVNELLQHEYPAALTPLAPVCLNPVPTPPLKPKLQLKIK